MQYSLIHNATLIDGNGAKPVFNAVILIKDNIIDYAGAEDSLDLPFAEIKKIDAGGGYLLPGFIDTHLHLLAQGFRMEDNLYTPLSLYFYQGVENMRRTLMAGVTTVRDAGLADIGVKQAVEMDLFPGPRIQISVMPLSTSGGHFDFHLNSGFDMKISYPGLPNSVCDGREEVRKRVREVLRAGAEIIKVMVTGGVISANDSPEQPQFTPEELEVMVEEAGYRGVKVMAHAHGVEGIKNALNAGILSIEHGTFIDEECIKLMLEKDAYLIPTLLSGDYLREQAENGDLPEYSQQSALDVVEILMDNMKKAYQAGVKIVMGTDSGVLSHGKNLRELGLLCEVGMTPMEAIQAGTKNAAQCLGWEKKVGTLEKGKLADVVISKTDPLSDINSLGNPDNIIVVIKDGKILKELREK
jgi:imidazolonepropionase-like amidohydrolase